MSEFKHTPGPWKACLNVPTAIIPGHIIKQDDSVQCPIASIPEGGGRSGKPTQLANAHLIAAAPDLLDALKNLLTASECADETGYVEDVGFMDIDAIKKSARKAIAKATMNSSCSTE